MSQKSSFYEFLGISGHVFERLNYDSDSSFKLLAKVGATGPAPGG